MIEPSRLFEEPDSDLERALLVEGRRYDSSERRRMATLVALGVGAAAAAGNKTGWALAATWKKAVVGTTLVASTGVGGVVAYRTLAQPAEPTEREPAAVVSVIEQPVSPTQPPVVDEEPTSTESDSVDVPVQSAAKPATRATPEPNRKSSPANTNRAKPSIRDEVALLDRARAAVGGGDGSLALRHLDHYASEFPKGSLRLEAEVLRIQALASAGRKVEASQRAKRLLARSPNSVVASRLRRYVVE